MEDFVDQSSYCAKIRITRVPLPDGLPYPRRFDRQFPGVSFA